MVKPLDIEINQNTEMPTQKKRKKKKKERENIQIRKQGNICNPQSYINISVLPLNFPLNCTY